MADLVQIAASLEALHPALDDEERHTVASRFGVGHADHHHQVGVDAVGDECLRSVEHELVAVAYGSGLDAREVRAGARFGHGNGGDQFAGGDAGEPARGLFLVAVLDEVRGDDVVVQGQAEASPVDAAAGQFIRDDRIKPKVCGPAAAVLFWN